NMPVGEAAIQVFDLSGKALNLNVEMIQGKAKLDLSGYAQGIYMLEWKQGPYTLHQKLIKE
ncbi:MAG: T9SS type A sorting domain-containing protein, partial [Bacteroidota bacterium]